MTERSEKTIFGGAGRFGLFFGPFQFLLDTSTLNKKPDLTAKRGDQLEQVGIRLDNLMAKHLDDTIDGAPGEERKSKPTAQLRFRGSRSARKIQVDSHVVDPGGLFRLPDPTRQSLAFFELSGARKPGEVFQLCGGHMPDGSTSQFVHRFIVKPYRTQNPITD